jgi:site-specific DNA recombinase
MLRNPAYIGTAIFGKTMTIHEPAGLNRVARLEGRTTPRAVRVVDRPATEQIAIPVPAIISRETFERAARRLEDNKRFAARNSKVPSLLQGLAACAPARMSRVPWNFGSGPGGLYATSSFPTSICG